MHEQSGTHIMDSISLPPTPTSDYDEDELPYHPSSGPPATQSRAAVVVRAIRRRRSASTANTVDTELHCPVRAAHTGTPNRSHVQHSRPRRNRTRSHSRHSIQSALYTGTSSQDPIHGNNPVRPSNDKYHSRPPHHSPERNGGLLLYHKDTHSACDQDSVRSRGDYDEDYAHEVLEADSDELWERRGRRTRSSRPMRSSVSLRGEEDSGYSSSSLYTDHIHTLSDKPYRGALMQLPVYRRVPGVNSTVGSEAVPPPDLIDVDEEDVDEAEECARSHAPRPMGARDEHNMHAQQQRVAEKKDTHSASRCSNAADAVPHHESSKDAKARPHSNPSAATPLHSRVHDVQRSRTESGEAAACDSSSSSSLHFIEESIPFTTTSAAALANETPPPSMNPPQTPPCDPSESALAEELPQPQHQSQPLLSIAATSVPDRLDTHEGDFLRHSSHTPEERGRVVDGNQLISRADKEMDTLSTKSAPLPWLMARRVHSLMNGPILSSGGGHYHERYRSGSLRYYSDHIRVGSGGLLMLNDSMSHLFDSPTSVMVETQGSVRADGRPEDGGGGGGLVLSGATHRREMGGGGAQALPRRTQYDGAAVAADEQRNSNSSIRSNSDRSSSHHTHVDIHRDAHADADAKQKGGAAAMNSALPPASSFPSSLAMSSGASDVRHAGLAGAPVPSLSPANQAAVSRYSAAHVPPQQQQQQQHRRQKKKNRWWRRMRGSRHAPEMCETTTPGAGGENNNENENEEEQERRSSSWVPLAGGGATSKKRQRGVWKLLKRVWGGRCVCEDEPDDGVAVRCNASRRARVQASSPDHSQMQAPPPQQQEQQLQLQNAREQVESSQVHDTINTRSRQTKNEHAISRDEYEVRLGLNRDSEQQQQQQPDEEEEDENESAFRRDLRAVSLEAIMPSPAGSISQAEVKGNLHALRHSRSFPQTHEEALGYKDNHAHTTNKEEDRDGQSRVVHERVLHDAVAASASAGPITNPSSSSASHLPPHAPPPSRSTNRRLSSSRHSTGAMEERTISFSQKPTHACHSSVRSDASTRSILFEVLHDDDDVEEEEDSGHDAPHTNSHSHTHRMGSVKEEENENNKTNSNDDTVVSECDALKPCMQDEAHESAQTIQESHDDDDSHHQGVDEQEEIEQDESRTSKEEQASVTGESSASHTTTPSQLHKNNDDHNSSSMTLTEEKKKEPLRRRRNGSNPPLAASVHSLAHASTVRHGSHTSHTRRVTVPHDYAVGTGEEKAGGYAYSYWAARSVPATAQPPLTSRERQLLRQLAQLDAAHEAAGAVHTTHIGSNERGRIGRNHKACAHSTTTTTTTTNAALSSMRAATQRSGKLAITHSRTHTRRSRKSDSPSRVRDMRPCDDHVSTAQSATNYPSSEHTVHISSVPAQKQNGYTCANMQRRAVCLAERRRRLVLAVVDAAAAAKCRQQQQQQNNQEKQPSHGRVGQRSGATHTTTSYASAFAQLLAQRHGEAVRSTACSPKWRVSEGANGGAHAHNGERNVPMRMEEEKEGNDGDHVGEDSKKPNARASPPLISSPPPSPATHRCRRHGNDVVKKRGLCSEYDVGAGWGHDYRMTCAEYKEAGAACLTADSLIAENGGGVTSVEARGGAACVSRPRRTREELYAPRPTRNA